MGALLEFIGPLLHFVGPHARFETLLLSSTGLLDQSVVRELDVEASRHKTMPP